MQCPYEGRRDKDGMAICNVLVAACGFTVSNSANICEACISGAVWNDADVPQLNADDKPRMPSDADALKLVNGTGFFGGLYKQSLRSRLVGGDCPRYQGLNPVDVGAAFAKYKNATSRTDAEDLLIEMYERQSRLGVEDGGDTEEVVADKLAVLAELNGMEEVLLEAAIEHERAAAILDLP